jgi:small-conductance mechanosensitive channel
MNSFLKTIFWGNTVLEYLIALGGIILAFFVLKLVRKVAVEKLKQWTARTQTIADDLLIGAIEKFLVPFAYIVVNYVILTQLKLSAKLANVLHVALVVVITFYSIRLINYLIHAGVQLYMQQKNEPPERVKQLNGILLVLKVLVWLAGFIMLVDNLGYDMTTLIAGLGVGGIAIALAAQNILGDLFSYLVIFFDKPFEVGDFINMSGHTGTVEKIGIKTSHVRSPDGQQLVMPNAELVKSVIHNYKRLQRRRVVIQIGVVYYTKAAKLRSIPSLIEEIITQQEMAEFDRAHLKNFGDFSLNFEVAYFVLSSDYKVYMDTNHEICLQIFERFEKEEIEFAFPTQTLFVEKNKIEQVQTDQEKI